MKKYLVTLAIVGPLLLAWPEAPTWLLVFIGLSVGGSCAWLDRRRGVEKR